MLVNRRDSVVLGGREAFREDFEAFGLLFGADADDLGGREVLVEVLKTHCDLVSGVSGLGKPFGTFFCVSRPRSGPQKIFFSRWDNFDSV